MYGRLFAKLGREPSKHDPRTLRLRDYRTLEPILTPATCPWHTSVSDWGVMGNNKYGNCVIVTAAHAILNWRANESHDTTRISDKAVIDLSYSMGALDGFSILERLKYWRSENMWGNSLWAYALVSASSKQEIKEAIHAFGVVDIGLGLPSAWHNDPIWDVGSGRDFRFGSWGLHSVPLCGYDSQYVYAVTWGEVQPITWLALGAYCDEAYALINPSWIENDSLSPSGFDLVALHAQLNAVSR